MRRRLPECVFKTHWEKFCFPPPGAGPHKGKGAYTNAKDDIGGSCRSSGGNYGHYRSRCGLRHDPDRPTLLNRQTSFSSSAESIIATGAFTAGGTDISGNKVDTATFPRGTIKIAHTGTQKGSFNPKTCLDSVTGTGTYSLSAGTGAYKGIHGSGTYKLSVRIVANRVAGKCSMKVKPQAFQLIISASGPVSLP